MEELGLGPIGPPKKNPIHSKPIEKSKKEKNVSLPTIETKPSAKAQSTRLATKASDEIKDYLPPLTDEDQKMKRKDKTDPDELSDSALKILDSNMQQFSTEPEKVNTGKYYFFLRIIAYQKSFTVGAIAPVSLRQKLHQLETSLAQQRTVERNIVLLTAYSDEFYRKWKIILDMLRMRWKKSIRT